MDWLALLFVALGILYVGALIWFVVYAFRLQNRARRANERIADALERVASALESRDGQSRT